MSKFETIVRKNAIELILVKYGTFLLAEKVTLSVKETMEGLNPLLTILTNNGELGLSSIDSIQAKIKACKLVQAGATFMANRVRDERNHLTHHAIRDSFEANMSLLKDENLGIDEESVAVISDYLEAHKRKMALKAKLESMYQAITDKAIKDIIGVYKSNFKLGFANLYLK